MESIAARNAHTQERWGSGDDNGVEEVNEDGGDVVDEPHDDGQIHGQDHEPDLSWTEHIDQRLSGRVEDRWVADGGEPDLEFVGHGTGWREGEDAQDREADQLGDDERENDDEREDGDPGDLGFIWGGGDCPGQQKADRRAKIIERDQLIEHLHAIEAPYEHIATKVGMSKTGVYNRCRKLGLPLRPRGRPSGTHPTI